MRMKSYSDRIRNALSHSIARVAANPDNCVKEPGKDFSRNRKLPLQAVLLMLVGMGGGSLTKELYEWFGYSTETGHSFGIHPAKR